MRRQTLVLLAGSALAACGGGNSGAESPVAAPSIPQAAPVRIRLTVDGQVATATLYYNATARGFAAQLPLSLTLTDYARIERIAYLPQRLPAGPAESTVPVNAGDLAYYAPGATLRSSSRMTQETIQAT